MSLEWTRQRGSDGNIGVKITLPRLELLASSAERAFEIKIVYCTRRTSLKYYWYVVDTSVRVCEEGPQRVSINNSYLNCGRVDRGRYPENVITTFGVLVVPYRPPPPLPPAASGKLKDAELPAVRFPTPPQSQYCWRLGDLVCVVHTVDRQPRESPEQQPF